MNKLRSIRRRGVRSRFVLGLIALLLALLAPPAAALAHPLDVYLQATYITVAPTQVIVELDLSPGVLVAPQVLPLLDTNGDQQISDAEGQAYVDTVLPNIALQVDGKPLALTVIKIEMPTYLTIQAGYGMLRVFTSANLPKGMTGRYTVSYKNNFAPAGSAYQVNAFVEKGAAITLGKQNRDSIQQSMTMDYSIGSAISTATAVTNTTAATSATAGLETQFGALGSSAQAQQLLGYLYQPTLDPWVLLLALALAVVLGGLHALTPGHGKTLVAAYLVGSRGTMLHAIALGSIVTFTHTFSVIIIGLLALFASQFIVPNVLVPLLEIFAGLLVVVMGARLVWQRWSAFRSKQNENDSHAHSASHAEGEYAQAFTHDHGDGNVHSHVPPAQGIKLSSLVAMGISGGLVPCPEALGIMVIAIGLNRILLGLGLIVSFSLGLAAVLIILGVLLVRSRSLVERFGGIGSRWTSALPLVSAVIVTVLGLAITFSALSTFLG